MIKKVGIGESVQTYFIDQEGIKLKVRIIKKRGINLYNLDVPSLSQANRALLNSIKTELIKEIELTSSQILDSRWLIKIRQQFKSRAVKLIREELPSIQENLLNTLSVILINEMLGLEDIEFLLNDPNLEEIVIVSANEPVRVYHKEYGWLNTNIFIKDK